MARGADGSMLTKEQLDQLNLDRYNQAVADGNLYNIGPIVDGGGTSFSPERWDDYFSKNPTVKPKDYTNQKDIQAKLDAGETINTDSQEFVVERDDVEVVSEEDMPPSYPKRGKDNSFMTKEQAQSEQSDISKEAEDEIKTQAPIDAIKSEDDEFDSPVSEWVKEFSSMEGEEFNSIKMAIEQLPANAQEAYATVAATKDDIQFEDALAKGSKANQDKIDAITDQAPTEEEMSQRYSDTKDSAMKEVDTMIREQDYQDEVKSIDDFYDGTTEKKGMLTSNTNKLGKGSGDAEADALLRDQAGDTEISDMKGKDREITTTIMKDTGLDMDQANALMGKLKGLCN
jgi:hypothetical protein